MHLASKSLALEDFALMVFWPYRSMEEYVHAIFWSLCNLQNLSQILNDYYLYIWSICTSYKINQLFNLYYGSRSASAQRFVGTPQEAGTQYRVFKSWILSSEVRLFSWHPASVSVENIRFNYHTKLAIHKQIGH